MRTLLVALLLAGPSLAKPHADVVADEWRIEGRTLHFTPRTPLGGAAPAPPSALAIDVGGLARGLGIEEDAVPAYVRRLDPTLPILVVPGFYKTRSVVGIRQLTEERLREDLRLELTPALEAKLSNRGRVTHRVVKANDGSESGWREPEIYLEREVDGKWVRGGKPGRCGLYAHDWQKDIVDLGPGDSLAVEGYLTPAMSFDLPKTGKVRLRAVYVYGGGITKRGVDAPKDPGPMGKTPPFTLRSEPVEIDLG